MMADTEDEPTATVWERGEAPRKVPMSEVGATVKGAMRRAAARGGLLADSTVSINGGPEMLASALKDALKVMRGAKARAKALAADSTQRDIEEDTGVPTKQREREAAAEGVAADRLRSIVERVERLNEEKKALGSDISDIFAEAKGAGFSVKALRQIIKMRTWEPAELEEHETLVDLYRRALGM
jgi:uncharacterized protein (UPF0335 family)